MIKIGTSYIAQTHDGKPLTELEYKFINNYISNGGNGSLAVKEAGYKCKATEWQASALLRRSHISGEIRWKLEQLESHKIATATEVLQFYSSVMRGEVLDQFGLEAALDTRIKAANELAKHLIEIPQKLEQKNITNNIGTIQMNFLPRQNNNLIEE